MMLVWGTANASEFCSSVGGETRLADACYDTEEKEHSEFYYEYNDCFEIGYAELLKKDPEEKLFKTQEYKKLAKRYKRVQVEACYTDNLIFIENTGMQDTMKNCSARKQAISNIWNIESRMPICALISSNDVEARVLDKVLQKIWYNQLDKGNNNIPVIVIVEGTWEVM